MRDNIDTFLTQMQNVLSNDLIIHIVSSYILKDANMRIIKRQKRYKQILCKELVEFHNNCYKDKNISLYRNHRDQIVLKNNSLDNRFFFYSEREHNQFILDNEHEKVVDCNDCNEVVLFNTANGEIVYDANGLPVQKKIKLYIMYI